LLYVHNLVVTTLSVLYGSLLLLSAPVAHSECFPFYPFQALIHDVDHNGVPNAQLVKEGAKVAAVYKNKSVAEQNSVDISWSLLMDPQFESFYKAICFSDEEQCRFRQLVVNSVMATDIVDKELKTLRNARWEKAFSEDHVDDTLSDTINRKATIVIEHLIQASDVAHTMQHWHIYRKWNERLFQEMYKAYKEGRAEKDPSEFWYKGEIGFFDFYIIPLAKKLKNCGAFGVSSDEYLNYAEKNRKEWESKGEAVVESMVEKYKKAYMHVEEFSDLSQAIESCPSGSLTATTSSEEDNATTEEAGRDEVPAKAETAEISQRVQEYLAVRRSTSVPSSSEEGSETGRRFL